MAFSRDRLHGMAEGAAPAPGQVAWHSGRLGTRPGAGCVAQQKAWHPPRGTERVLRWQPSGGTRAGRTLCLSVERLGLGGEPAPMGLCAGPIQGVDSGGR